ncbi:MAG: hypothetical protein V1697_01580 [Candidatus Levyibacteriota bacterium]
MLFYLSLPLILLRFWFIEAPVLLISFFISLNKTIMGIISLPLLVKTYFKPWKNEYREGLVGFSIGMGIFIKTFVILADLFLMAIVLLIEFSFILLFIAFPILTFYLIFI